MTTHNAIPLKSKYSDLMSFILLILFLSSCQSATSTPVTEDTTSSESSPLQTSIPDDQMVFWDAWRQSPHGDTYDISKGPNTYCARCHSPRNWDPAATIDPPPNCVSCKFQHEPEPRIAVGNPMVPEEEWFDIGCVICHQIDEGITSPEISWFNTQIGYHETVNSPTALCGKCHTNNEPFLYHGRELGQDTHKDFVCTSCHDPHSTTASCGEQQCHSDVLVEQSRPTSDHIGIESKEVCLECHPQNTLIDTMETDHSDSADCLGCHQSLVNLTPADTAPVHHSKIHSLITCVACHDASGLEVGPVEGQQQWVTFRTLQTPVGPNTTPYQSHNLRRQVDCQRCHFTENPWGLQVSNTGGTP